MVEGKIDPRWPINTRGNIGEVFPEVLTPLSYMLAVISAEKGWRDAFRTMGILASNDLRREFMSVAEDADLSAPAIAPSAPPPAPPASAASASATPSSAPAAPSSATPAPPADPTRDG
jgi:hypothetical protein